MITRFLKRTALLGGVLLVSMSIGGRSALAAPPGPAPPGGHLNITEVFVNFGPPDTITITGEDFDFGPGPLVVTLGEFGSLSIISDTDTVIVATLPANIPGGDFLLTVSTGNGQSQNDEYDLTIGAVVSYPIETATLGSDVNVPTSTTTAILSKPVTFPSFSPTGSFHVVAYWNLYLSSGGGAHTAVGWVTDGTNKFAVSQQEEFGGHGNTGAGPSPVTYAPGSTETFTLNYFSNVADIVTVTGFPIAGLPPSSLILRITPF